MGGFWNDAALTNEERIHDAWVARVRRAIGLTAVFGDEGRGIECYGAWSLDHGNGVSVRCGDVDGFVPLSAFRPTMSSADIRETLANACDPDLAARIGDLRDPGGS